MDYAKESLKMHYELKGKIEVVSRAKVDSKDALSLALRFRKILIKAMSLPDAGILLQL